MALNGSNVEQLALKGLNAMSTGNAMGKKLPVLHDRQVPLLRLFSYWSIQLQGMAAILGSSPALVDLHKWCIIGFTVKVPQHHTLLLARTVLCHIIIIH